MTIVKGNVIKENNQTLLIIPTTLTNNTVDTLRYYSMSCSWQDFYSVDNYKLQVEGPPGCDKNIPKILTLAPKRSKTVEIRLLVSQSIKLSGINFRIGFNLIKASRNETKVNLDYNELLKNRNRIWSNRITI